MARRTVRVSDSDTASGTEGLARVHAGRDHSPHHPTPGPVPHPEPGPRKRSLMPTGAVQRAH